MAAFGKIASLSGYRGQAEPETRESNHYPAQGLRISELPGAAFAAITLFYIVSEIGKLIW
jgi:hypothetical protein